MALSPNDLFTSGQILTAQECNNYGFSTVGLTNNSALTQAGVTTEVDITGMSVTFTAIANRNYKISACIYAIPTVTNACGFVAIKQGTTYLQQSITNLGISAIGCTVQLFVTKTFTAGAQTVKLSGALGTGSTGTVSFSALSGLPAILLVEDVGPA